MTKKRNQVAETPKSKSLKAINVNSVKISRNKSTRKNSPRKKNEKSPAIAKSKVQTKFNSTLNSKTSEPEQFSSPSTKIDNVCNIAKEGALRTPSSTKKCTIRLRRLRHTPSTDDCKTQLTQNEKSTLKTHRMRREHKLEEDKSLHSNSLMFADVALTSSTPVCGGRSFGAIQREPFKVLNLQELVRSNEKCQQIFNKQPIITKENRESMKKLSLSLPKYPFKNLEKRHKVMNFEPLRNSTLYEVDENLEESVLEMEPSNLTSNQPQDLESKEPSNIGCTKNLANKSDLIEQLLMSDNEEEQDGGIQSSNRNETTLANKTNRNETTLANKTNKFFHRCPETTKMPSPEVVKTKEVTKSKRLSRQKRLTQRKNSVGSIYEFLSQSQTSDTDTMGKKHDPAADVIQKLIEQGKVLVATHKKGSGKLRMKRKKETKKRQKRIKMPEEKKTEKIEVNNNDDVYDNDDSHYNEDIEEPEVPNDAVPIAENVHETRAKPVSSINPDTTAGGDTFSTLARSVLISETKKKEKRFDNITYRRKLLDVAQKFVSTPVRKECPPLDKTANISPITSAPKSLINAKVGCPSPWRVDDDAHLPNVFYFNRNSANLPSFSSDYIPSSPKKQRHRYQDLLPEPDAQESNANLEDVDNSKQSIIPNVDDKQCSQHSSSLSTFSSNDSNAENRPPPGFNNNPSISGIESFHTINQQQQLNSRRELSSRSPLQILDVVTLPAWNAKQQYVPKQSNQRISRGNANLSKDQRKDNKSDLFGFEEFIEDDNSQEDSLVNEEVQAKATESSSTDILRNKLHHLKHLRPEQEELPSYSGSKRIAPVFDNGDCDSANKQLKINNMLCSTMINDIKLPTKRNKINIEPIVEPKKLLPTELFIDPEPESSFHENDSLRTYVRPYKRKKKLRHNFVMLMDSDESDDEEEDRQNDNPDTNKEWEVEQKKKKQKKEPKQIEELNSFMNEFNEMCKEVDGYELIVE